jgi:hypothetical protein
MTRSARSGYKNPTSLRPGAGAACLTLMLLAAASAYAQPAADDPDDYINPDRPGIADGSNVIGGNRFQIETGIQTEYHNNDAGHYQRLFFPTLLRLGVDDSWEIRTEGNTYSWMKSHETSQGVTENDGIAPTSIGVKYHFVDSGGAQRPSVGAILRVFPPSGTGTFRTAHTTGDLRFVSDWDFAPEWSLNPNLGVAIYNDDATHPFTAGLAAVTLNYNPSKVLNFFIDSGIQSPETSHGRTSIIFDVGAAYVIGRDIQLDISVGTGATGATAPRSFWSAGISKRF